MKTPKKSKPCAKCPYKQGLVKFVTSPCRDCEEKDYQTYKRLAQIKLPFDAELLK